MTPHPPRQVPRTKVCVACKVRKAASEFRPNARMKSGLESYCRPCAVAKSAEWRAKNPDKVKRLAAARPKRTTDERWAVMLWVNYRIKPEEYWALHAKQGGVCAICGEAGTTKRGMLHVDHCHETGQIRGLLCHRCNLALGHMRDRVDLLRKAIDYLQAR